MPPSNAKTALGQPFIELSAVESTNIYAMDHLQANLAAHGIAFFAHHQTAGIGQRGKKWISEPGSNIVMTVIIDCSFLSISNPFPLSLMAALACRDFFSRYVPEDIFIKWPNDLYWRDRKAGGVLIQNKVRGNKWLWGVVGIGININQVLFPEFLINPVSLKQITGKNHHPVDLAKELCECLEFRYKQLTTGLCKEMLSQYNQHLYKRGEVVTLKKETLSFPCLIISVSARGELLVSGGEQEHFGFDEVEWVLDKSGK